MKQDNAQTRKDIRRQRRLLTAQQQLQHQQAVLKRLTSLPRFMHAKRIAIYHHNDGELQTNLIIRQLQELNKLCYLPVLYPLHHNRLWFLPVKKNQRLKKNRFQIPEPLHINDRIMPWTLDIICMPLVAFDDYGNRLGMGGGYYDRTLSPCKKQAQMKQPLLIGLAHELQRVTAINTNHWDIPLDAVITERHTRIFSKALL